MLFLGFNLSAQNLTAYQDTLHIHINFRQGYSFVDSSYCDNRAQLDSLVTLLNGAVSDSLSIVRSVTVKGCASPEGYESYSVGKTRPKCTCLYP